MSSMMLSLNCNSRDWRSTDILIWLHRPILRLPIYIYRHRPDKISFGKCPQNAVIFLTHSHTLPKKPQQSKSRQLSCSNASRCVFIKKQTRLTMEHVSSVVAKTKASSESFAMLEAYCLDRTTMCRCCVWINSSCTSKEVFVAWKVWL